MSPPPSSTLVALGLKILNLSHSLKKKTEPNLDLNIGALFFWRENAFMKTHLCKLEIHSKFDILFLIQFVETWLFNMRVIKL